MAPRRACVRRDDAVVVEERAVEEDPGEVRLRVRADPEAPRAGPVALRVEEQARGAPAGPPSAPARSAGRRRTARRPPPTAPPSTVPARMLAPPTAASTAPPMRGARQRARRDELRGREPEQLPRLLREEVLRGTPAARARPPPRTAPRGGRRAPRRARRASSSRARSASWKLRSSRSRCASMRGLVLHRELLGVGERVDEEAGDDGRRLGAAPAALRDERAPPPRPSRARQSGRSSRKTCRRWTRSSNVAENASKSRTILKYWSSARCHSAAWSSVADPVHERHPGPAGPAEDLHLRLVVRPVRVGAVDDVEDARAREDRREQPALLDEVVGALEARGRARRRARAAPRRVTSRARSQASARGASSKPGVSTSTNSVRPSTRTGYSRTSVVVPGRASIRTVSSSASVATMLDLPLFTRPTTAKRGTSALMRASPERLDRERRDPRAARAPRARCARSRRAPGRRGAPPTLDHEHEEVPARAERAAQVAHEPERGTVRRLEPLRDQHDRLGAVDRREPSASPSSRPPAACTGAEPRRTWRATAASSAARRARRARAPRRSADRSAAAGRGGRRGRRRPAGGLRRERRASRRAARRAGARCARPRRRRAAAARGAGRPREPRDRERRRRAGGGRRWRARPARKRHQPPTSAGSAARPAPAYEVGALEARVARRLDERERRDGVGPEPRPGPCERARRARGTAPRRGRRAWCSRRTRCRRRRRGAGSRGARRR